MEHLHAENESEWSRREHLESDKLALERDNKKIKTEVQNLEEEMERKTKQNSVILDVDLKTLQNDIVDKTRVRIRKSETIYHLVNYHTYPFMCVNIYRM